MASAPPTEQTKTKQRHRTLGSLLKYWISLHVKVELKNGRTYSGTLESADMNLSLTLTDVVQLHPAPPKLSLAVASSSASSTTYNNEIPILPLMQIRGSTIRYIHFPDQVDLAVLVKAGIQRERAAADKYKRGVRKAPAKPPP